MSVIEEAMKQGLEDVAAGPICDPGCVAEIDQGRRRRRADAQLAARSTWPAMGLKGKPLKITGKVKAINRRPVRGDGADGHRGDDPHGRTAVLDNRQDADRGLGAAFRAVRLAVFTHCGMIPGARNTC